MFWWTQSDESHNLALGMMCLLRSQYLLLRLRACSHIYLKILHGCWAWSRSQPCTLLLMDSLLEDPKHEAEMLLEDTVMARFCLWAQIGFFEVTNHPFVWRGGRDDTFSCGGDGQTSYYWDCSLNSLCVCVCVLVHVCCFIIHYHFKSCNVPPNLFHTNVLSTIVWNSENIDVLSITAMLIKNLQSVSADHVREIKLCSYKPSSITTI